MSTVPTPFTALVAATADAVRLSMQRLWMTGEVTPAGARVVVEHIFRSEEKGPVEVVYAFPLPRDAAIRRFRISGDGFEAHSELKRTDEAVETYERGIAAGALAALVRAYGDGIVNLTVGNIRPQETITVELEIVAGVEAQDDGFRFRFPFTLPPRYHSAARAVSTDAGEGELELPADQFGDVMLPPVRRDASGLHEVGFDLALAAGLEVDELASPSHGIRVRRGSADRSRVSLAAAAGVPDRDLVLEAHYARSEAQVVAAAGGNGRTQFAAIIPSSAFGEIRGTPRRIAFLLDRSGSMDGAPIEQARKALEACLALLAAEDEFTIIAFDDRVEALGRTLLPGTRANRDRAHDFLLRVNARGGTELARGVERAATILGQEGADVLVLTDGQVAGTEEILARARSAGMRLHCLGIGSAGQDRFLALLARETGGISRFVTPRERVDLAAVNLFASVGRPVATGLRTDPAVMPEPPDAVFASTPVVLYGEGDADCEALVVSWSSGRLSLPMTRDGARLAETLRIIRGSRLITDWESRYLPGEALGAAGKRKQSRIAGRLVALSEEYELASREMSLVAVVRRAGDRPGEVPDTRIVPVGMPQDVDFGAYFAAPAVVPPAAPLLACCPEAGAVASKLVRAHRRKAAGSALSAPPPPPPADEDALVELASRIEPDGGMPGAAAEDRAGATVLALLAFVSNGHTLRHGVFRMHVARLVAFLEVAVLPRELQEVVDAALAAVRRGRVAGDDWLQCARQGGDPWPRLHAAFATM